MKIPTNKYLFIFTILFFSNIFAKLNIITSIPDIADIAKNVGGDSVYVFSLARGSEDYHFVQAKSSFLPKINRAHLVLCLGLEAENFWLKPLVSSARNKRVKKGNPGWVEVYKGLDILERPTDKEAKALQHPGGHRFGNPHYNNGPYAGKYMAKNIYEAYLNIDRKNKEYYTMRYKKYLQKLDDMEKHLLKKAAPLKGVHVISYHADLAYFCNFYGMIVTGCLEPKPGIPPNSKHLSQLIAKAKKEKVKLVLYHQAQNPRLPQKIAKRVGARTVCFANMVKSRKKINSFIQLQEYNLDIMLKTLLKSGGK